MIQISRLSRFFFISQRIMNPSFFFFFFIPYTVIPFERETEIKWGASWTEKGSNGRNIEAIMLAHVVN